MTLKKFIFRERGKEGERKGEKYQCVVASCAPPTGNLAYNPGMFPDRELDWRPFGSQVSAQPTEPHRPGWCFAMAFSSASWQFWITSNLIFRVRKIYVQYRLSQYLLMLSDHFLLPLRKQGHSSSSVLPDIAGFDLRLSPHQRLGQILPLLQPFKLTVSPSLAQSSQTRAYLVHFVHGAHSHVLFPDTDFCLTTSVAQ